MNTSCPLMKQNEGTVDRVLRITVGFIALYAGYSSLNGLAQTIAYVVAAIALITGIIGFCGLYSLLGISTRKTK
jgi:hypothetical protein